MGIFANLKNGMTGESSLGGWQNSCFRSLLPLAKIIDDR
jgi:hypothetical protein